MNTQTHTAAQLVLGALLFGATAVLLPSSLPLRLLGLVLLISGYFGVLNWLGFARPLNRLSAVAAGLGAAAYAGWLCIEPSPAALGFFGVFALLGALFVTGVAALHRDGTVRRAGAIGTLVAGLPLAALVIGHIALGGFGLLGLAWGQTAATGPHLTTWPADLLLGLIGTATGLAWRRISATTPLETP